MNAFYLLPQYLLAEMTKSLAEDVTTAEKPGSQTHRANLRLIYPIGLFYNLRSRKFKWYATR